MCSQSLATATPLNQIQASVEARCHSGRFHHPVTTCIEAGRELVTYLQSKLRKRSFSQTAAESLRMSSESGNYVNGISHGRQSKRSLSNGNSRQGERALGAKEVLIHSHSISLSFPRGKESGALITSGPPQGLIGCTANTQVE